MTAFKVGISDGMMKGPAEEHTYICNRASANKKEGGGRQSEQHS
jgi:hypothetical protein